LPRQTALRFLRSIREMAFGDIFHGYQRFAPRPPTALPTIQDLDMPAVSGLIFGVPAL
jgi:hypothetical protein